jgi:hypothetical protein
MKGDNSADAGIRSGRCFEGKEQQAITGLDDLTQMREPEKRSLFS